MAIKKTTEKELPKIKIDQLKSTTTKKTTTKKAATEKKTATAKKTASTAKKTTSKKDDTKHVTAGTKKIKKATLKTGDSDEKTTQTTTVDESTVTIDTSISNDISNTAYVSGQFHKVSFEQFVESFRPIYLSQLEPDQSYSDKDIEDAAKVIYDLIKLPERATAGSNGYDFFFPFGDTEIAPGQSIIIPTGIKVELNPNWALLVYSRSSLGFKYRVLVEENVAVIDEDYFNNISNEGHIFIKIINDNREGQTVTLRLGAAFCQGIFTLTGRAVNDKVTSSRVGGFGSTDK